MFSPNQKFNRVSEKPATSYAPEKAALFASLFLFAFGMGLITDGKKLQSQQLKISQRVDFHATLNPYQ